MEDKKFGLLRGLSEIYIDEISDSAEAYTPAGKPEQLIPAGELKIKKSVDKTQVYFDNALYAEVRKENASEMELVGAAIRAMFNAWLEGKSIDTTTGAIMDDGEAHEKYFAISGKKDYTDGTSEFTAYKTQFKFTNGNKAAKVVRIDTSTTKIKADASWTKQVVTPDNLSEVIEKATSV